jgi:OmcA/MtrC family decaheme c-type cytochrome
MNRFDTIARRAWPVLLACALAFALGGCEGDDGKDGTAGAAGRDGTDGTNGTDGISCWDLNANGVGDTDEDINGDGVVDVNDCAPDADPISAAVAAAEVESCATCHGGVGEQHQAFYDLSYNSPSNLELKFATTDISSVNVAVDSYTVTLNFTITDRGLPYQDALNTDATGFLGLDQARFYTVQHFAGAAEEYLNSCRLRIFAVVDAANGEYSVTSRAGDECKFAPETSNAQVYGYITRGEASVHSSVAGSEFQGSHVHLYDDVSNWAVAFGTAVDGAAGSYLSAANSQGCEKCHGTPYLKHGYRAAIVENIPEFAACKVCHYDNRSGGHEDWQYMVDQPLAWANDALSKTEVETTYAYTANIMNDVHMSHAMEFPYPQSAANCATCHGQLYDDEGAAIAGTDKLATVLDNSNFQMETCMSCHPLEGVGAWPGEDYYQSHRAPAFAYLWQRDGDLSFHENLAPGTDCTECHGNANIGAPAFIEYHNGYDAQISNAAGERYANLFDASIDSIDVTGDVITIGFSADDSGIANAVADSMDIHVYVSFYGWDTKHFIVPSHTRDNSDACRSGSGSVRGCRLETSTAGFSADTANNAYNPLFPSLTEVSAGSWELEVDMAAWIGGLPDTIDEQTIPELITAGKIRKGEVTLAPRLDVITNPLDDPEDYEEAAAALDAVTQTFDIASGALVADYFKGTKAVVDAALCNDCHDQLAVTFHSGRGRGGDIVACKNCHNPTYDGSHLEMASRSIENYVHGIHSFQAFDTDDIFNDRDGNPDFDPVLARRYDLHVNHTFPNFTIRNCEACHLPGTYNAPDQSASMPGVLSRSYDVATWYKFTSSTGFLGTKIDEDKAGRNIGSVDGAVVGPASRSCGGCHRADLINDDAAGDLAAFNAHTETFGTYVSVADPDDEEGQAVLIGIIDKIMTWFE